MSASNTPPPGEPASISILFLDAAGKIALATGIGKDPVARALATDREWMEEMERKRLSVPSSPRSISPMTYSSTC
jgi:hypothetical protein